MPAHPFTFSRPEKLKSQIIIQQLFSSGKSQLAFPFRMVWTENTNPQSPAQVQVSVSVSTRNFKHAVDRNRIKRQMRECYRLNKQLLIDFLPPQHPQLAIMFIFVGKKHLPYKLLNRKLVELLTYLRQYYENRWTHPLLHLAYCTTVVNIAHSVLSTCHIALYATRLPLHPYLLALCRRCNTQTRSHKRRILSHTPHTVVPPMEQRRIRPSALISY